MSNKNCANVIIRLDMSFYSKQYDIYYQHAAFLKGLGFGSEKEKVMAAEHELKYKNTRTIGQKNCRQCMTQCDKRIY